MIMEYLLYFYQLPEEEKVRQVLMFILFFIILFAIVAILEFLKIKYKGKTNNQFFKKVLDKI